eukprot:CAMPEP_0196752710 /NCGR_PEP_ID=MMETSP1091-20130531/87997_1 /TAXON_ID=302021 /ORGANISM="Rhodomonas sp., Strain CCMP768" /LENGTH=75 /DNA_ID=CAMNT_0042100701 /DNA_START=240 /DNA_END=463 /DNA_ORIENTATION=+
MRVGYRPRRNLSTNSSQMSSRFFARGAAISSHRSASLTTTTDPARPPNATAAPSGEKAQHVTESGRAPFSSSPSS